MKKIGVLNLKASVISGILIGANFMGLEAAKLSDVIDKATISGFAFTRVQTLHGADGEGTRWQWRFKPTITTGEVAGWSASAGIFFSKGSSTPDSNTSDNDIGGSRGDTINSFVDRFNIGDFYITHNAKETLGTNTKIIAGQKSPGTPFNDNNLDRALGVFIENSDISALNVGFQWWDTWMGDDIYISIPKLDSKGAGIGNNMFMLYVKSSKDFTKDTGLSYNLYYSFIHRWVNAMIFGDVAYNMGFGNNSLTLTGQVSFTSIANNPLIFSNSAIGGVGGLYRSSYNYAKNRGMYNIRVDYRYNFTKATEDGDSKSSGFFGASAGFAGSFGDGFGTLIDNTGGLKLGGHLWNSFSGAEANGFGILGVGGFKNSSIIVPYAKAEFGYKKFGAALDLAYVDASHFFWLKKGSTGTNLNKAPNNLYGDKNYIKAANFLDVALSATYKFTDSLNMGVYYGYAIGNPSFGRFRFQANYVF